MLAASQPLVSRGELGGEEGQESCLSALTALCPGDAPSPLCPCPLHCGHRLLRVALVIQGLDGATGVQLCGDEEPGKCWSMSQHVSPHMSITPQYPIFS